MARKRKRVPEVLWRLFGNRARTLIDTILALIPPPSGECRCKGRRCISCSGRETRSFLIRSGDSSDYRKLLNGCFVVVSGNAPPIPVLDPQCRWSQREVWVYHVLEDEASIDKPWMDRIVHSFRRDAKIVRRSIEIILHEQPFASNLICSSYDKGRRSSDVVDALTSSKWTVLLRRVGDAMMMYLLKYTSLFLPLPQKKYHQISGCPISDFFCEFSKRITESNPQHHSPACNGSKKRKRVEGDESISRKQHLNTYSLGSAPSSNSCIIPGNGSSCVTVELSHKKSEGSLKKNTSGSQKRTRQYRWQRQRKRKQLVVQEQEEPSLIPCRGHDCNSNDISFCASSSHSDKSNISQCFCCSVFQNVPRINRNAEIDRRNMFYKSESSSSMFPKKHILRALKPSDSNASLLFNDIFGIFGINDKAGAIPCFLSKNGGPFNSTCLYHTLTKLLKSLIRECQNCRYLRLLEKHCSIRSSYQDASRAGTRLEKNDSGTNLSTSKQDGAQSDETLSLAANTENCKMISEATTDQIEPINRCPKKEIVSFIWAVCRRIVPSPLLGEPSNWRILRRNISKFIHLRRYEKFSLKECTYKLKISKFPLFKNKNTGCSDLGVTDKARHAILDVWIFWFFKCLVSPLVEANFYVTESEHEKREVLYYPKSTWEKLMREAKCMKDGRYRLLNHATAREILGNRSFGFSRARLCPKQNGFRILANLRAPSRMPLNPLYSNIPSSQKLRRKAFSIHPVAYQFFKSVNSVLQDLHVVLKGLQAKEPEKLGSSVFDYNDVYRKLVPFLFLLKNRSTSLANVFMVVSDVSKAYDSVNQDKLLSVMKDIIVDEEFTLEKFTHVNCARKSLKVNQHLTLANQDVVTTSASIKSRFWAHTLDSVVVKKEVGRKINKEEMNSILKEHITRNVVQLENNFYLQRIGIPQGSVLSSLLCSFYYGHMEKNVVFPFLEKANEDRCGYESLLLRFIDDFLFISSSEKQATMFFSRLERGVRDYNCCMNEEKYGVNFIMNEGQGSHSNRLLVGKDGISFLRWSGLLVNCSTLEIQADYTRYLDSHLSSTLTVISQGKVGSHLKEKLRSYLRPKCHPIFYDSNINSPHVVRLNIYQVFLLCAMKFLSHLSNLSVLPTFTPKFCLKAIDSSLRYMNRLIKRKMYSIKINPTFRPKYDVKKKEIIWLGLYAYSRVLKKKQSRYNDLLRLCVSRLRAYGEVEKISPEMKYAIDDAHSSVLWSIRY